MTVTPGSLMTTLPSLLRRNVDILPKLKVCSCSACPFLVRGTGFQYQDWALGLSTGRKWAGTIGVAEKVTIQDELNSSVLKAMQ